MKAWRPRRPLEYTDPILIWFDVGITISVCAALYGLWRLFGGAS